MDYRKRVTQKIVKEAMIELLEEKPLHKIKVKELCEKAIEEIDKLISELNEKLVIIKPKHERLLRLIDETEKLNNKVDLDRFLNCGNDFESDDYPKDQLVRMIDTCKTMGKLINETIAMQM